MEKQSSDWYALSSFWTPIRNILNHLIEKTNNVKNIVTTVTNYRLLKLLNLNDDLLNNKYYFKYLPWIFKTFDFIFEEKKTINDPFHFTLKSSI